MDGGYVHEQACAIAAKGYTQLTGKQSGVCVTSVPQRYECADRRAGLYISGPMKQSTTIAACPQQHLRQLQTLCPKSASFMDENGKMTSAPLEKMAPFMPDKLQQTCVYENSEM
jgi:thiamine pyrophosphate-dependent acetolactate synthase large subunit-like protein